MHHLAVAASSPGLEGWHSGYRFVKCPSLCFHIPCDFQSVWHVKSNGVQYQKAQHDVSEAPAKCSIGSSTFICFQFLSLVLLPHHSTAENPAFLQFLISSYPGLLSCRVSSPYPQLRFGHKRFGGQEPKVPVIFGCGQKGETNINISLQLYEDREMRSRGLFSVIRVEKFLQPEEWFAFLET